MNTMFHGSVAQYKGFGILCLGTPGSGKSDLMLRLMNRGGMLVADDQVIFTSKTTKEIDKGYSEQLFAQSPAEIQGKLEVRGLGILTFPYLPEALVSVVLNLVTREQVERLPLPKTKEILNISIPCFEFCPFDSSWEEKLTVILNKLI